MQGTNKVQPCHLQILHFYFIFKYLNFLGLKTGYCINNDWHILKEQLHPSDMYEALTHVPAIPHQMSNPK